MDSSGELDKLAPALLAAQKELKPIVKDATNPHFHSTFVSLDALLETVRPILNRHNLALLQGCDLPTFTSHGLTAITVECILLHTSGQWVKSNAVIAMAKADPQGAGGAITYGRRYSLASILGVANEDDDDGNHATTGTPAPAVRAAPRATGKGGVMPFGKTRGKPLVSLDDSELISAMDWNLRECPDKFADFRREAQAILDSRSGTSETDYDEFRV